MVKKIFTKKKNNSFVKKFIFLFLICLLFLFFIPYFNKSESFLIPTYTTPFYSIPKDKGGKFIENQNKRGLHLSYNDNNNIEIKNNLDLKYSIQLMTSDDYDLIKGKRDQLLDNKENMFVPGDLYINILKTDLGNDYFLLYKNFQSRIEGYEFCKKNAYFFEKCIIVNFQNLD
jgi:hypothetical protein